MKIRHQMDIEPTVHFYELQRLTGIQVDPSGNVWAANNWIPHAFLFPRNPGGDYVVMFVSLAGPVKTPLLGPPRQP